jgi:hypothetical protein
MIYKFKDLENPDFFAEFFLCTSIENTLVVQLTDNENKTTDVNLNQEQLFELIGGLLRIQSKMKGTNNG